MNVFSCKGHYLNLLPHSLRTPFLHDHACKKEKRPKEENIHPWLHIKHSFRHENQT